MTKRRNKRQNITRSAQTVAPDVKASSYPSQADIAAALADADQQVLTGLQRALGARVMADRSEARAVATARVSGMSWDRIGGYLDVSGETLRRRHGGIVR